MGNSNSNVKKDQFVNDFNNLNTENYSDSNPRYFNKIQKESAILAEKLNKYNELKKKYNEKFSKKSESFEFSDTSPLETAGKPSNSNTSELNTEIKNAVNNQTGGFNNIVLDVNSLEKNQTGGGNHVFINADMIKDLMTETNQTGGFFFSKKKNKNSETFISKEMMENVLSNSAPSEQKNMNNGINDTSEVNSELNEYIKNAVSELTSTLENNQAGGALSSSEELNSESENSDSIIRIKKDTSSTVSNHSGNSYISSSAGSDEINSNTNLSSTISVGNDKYLSDSINTSDINMISVDE